MVARGAPFDVVVEQAGAVPVARQAVEFVERKGLGHPDTICDLLAEAVSRALDRAYLDAAGRVLHYNVDNAFLVAGRTEPALGGGRVRGPMRLVYGDRATSEVDGRPIPVAEIAEAAIAGWFRDNLPLVDPDAHLVLQDELQPGSVQISDMFAGGLPGSNDTCVASGFAPLTETERLVLDLERHLNSPGFKAEHPESGQDIKVTAARQRGHLRLALSHAFVDAHVPHERAYFAAKEAIAAEVEKFAADRLRAIDRCDVAINTLDRPGRGADGLYLTVLGTSAEAADGGQVGRGNRASGLTSFHRPMAGGAVAGKNPVSNVGKVYNLFAQEVAGRVYQTVPGLDEVYVTLCSRIGEPLDRPALAAIRLTLSDGAVLGDVESAATETMRDQVAQMGLFVDRLVRQPRPVC